ncbi:MAG: serine/threonine dehydratase [Reichenbachiella sp.]|uniref:serine/threonine dehydratase n=1 Tax=Reichenbachiella sp. TaxID=2184521 RepID=UPI00326477DD
MQKVDIQQVINAKNRIDKYINQTPILTSSQLNSWLGHDIFFKAECLQKIGAFKARGAANTIAWLVENNQKPDRIIANSSGNHAQAVAWASSMFGIPSTIYMPEYSSKIKIQATTAYGADVVLCQSRTEADEKVKQAATVPGNYWIPPFNHEQIIYGQATAAYDAIKEIKDVDAVIAPCGGGGLLSGTYISTKALLPKAEVIGAEPLNANDAAQSLRTGKIQRLQSVPDTLADGAMTNAISELTFEYLKELNEFYEVDETQMTYWTQWLSHLLKVQVEPTSALSMEAARQWLTKQSGKKRVLIILSGGNIDQGTHQRLWEKDFLSTHPAIDVEIASAVMMTDR